MNKFEPMGQEGQDEVRAFCARVVDDAIEWRPELYQLMGCAMSVMDLQCQRQDPLHVLEDFSAVSALLCYAATIGWITERASHQLCTFARWNRDQTLKQWSGQLVTVTRGGGMPQSTTKH